MKLVCLSSIDWDFLWQRHQVFMKHFADTNWEVTFVENTGFRNPALRDLSRLLGRLRKWGQRSANRRTAKGTQGLNIVTPFVLPPNGWIFRKLNQLIFVPKLQRKISRNMRLKQVDVAFVYLPTETSLQILERLNPRVIIYDCVANFAGHPDRPSDFRRIEGALLNKADLVLTDSDFLYTWLKEKHKSVMQLHHGVDLKLFLKAPVHTPKSYKSVCFFGAIDNRVDYESLSALKSAGADVCLIGPEISRVPQGLRVIPPVSYSNLPETIAKFDILIIPYKINEFTDGIIPAKLFECLATGKPVLVSNLPSIHPYSEALYICTTPEQYVHTFRNLGQTETEHKRLLRRGIAAGQSSENTFIKLDALVESLVGMKR